MKKYFKCLLCGVIVAFLNNLIYILSLYDNIETIYNVALYVCPFFIMFISSSLMLPINTTYEYIKSIGVILLTTIASEFMLLLLGVTNYFYFQANQDATEVALGEGVILVSIYTLNFVGLLVGFVFSLVRSKYTMQKKTGDKATKGTCKRGRA